VKRVTAAAGEGPLPSASSTTISRIWGRLIPVALRDVGPAQLLGMPEVQLARRLHCVPAEQEEHPRQGCYIPTLYQFGNLFTLAWATHQR
jgi:hypothetical protein